MTYGSNATGKATGFFTFDVWSPADGASSGHLTLPNGTGTDTSCSAQLVLPTSSGDALLAGGDVWDGTAVKKTGNSCS